MTARPQVAVYDINEAAKQTGVRLALPAVLASPIRTDIVQKVHTDLNKNRRQASGVKISSRGTADFYKFVGCEKEIVRQL